MKRLVDRNGTYILQLTAYLMYFYHRDLYGLAEKEADIKLKKEDPEFWEATQIMKKVLARDHYNESFRNLFEVYYGKKFHITKQDDWNPYKGSVILVGEPHNTSIVLTEP